MMATLGRNTRFTWLGHTTFLVQTPRGRRLLIDPWLEQNPKCPDRLKDPGKVDLVLITHGHFDHTGDAVALLKRTRAQVVAIFEIASWLASKGIETTVPMNKGGTVEVGGVKVTMVHALHSSSLAEGDRLLYGGEAAGYVVEVENGFRFYHAGDTAVFSDMALIGELYRPEVAILPIGDHFTMGPREAAKAAELIGATHVIPMHFGTFDVLKGTPAALREHLRHRLIQVHELAPGDTLE
ncbi:MAG: metal-dependent hydrolase [Planctomycetota bacterium]